MGEQLASINAMHRRGWLRTEPDGNSLMRMRTRKLVGTFALLALVIVYSLAAMMVAIALQVNASKFVEVMYYVVAGLAWVIPAGAIIWWMQKED